MAGYSGLELRAKDWTGNISFEKYHLWELNGTMHWMRLPKESVLGCFFMAEEKNLQRRGKFRRLEIEEEIHESTK